VLEYRHATAFECLIGHLYYTGQQARIRELVDSSIQFMMNRPK
jgi:ribonuclease-3 family protein